ncbi:MAG TPA: hypothetical protein VI542_08385 [Candidatus Tectomicrobia bacterium]
MESTQQQDTHPPRRPRIPEERRALWKEVQRLWRKRAANTQDLLASMREEWERELPSLQQP